MTTAWNALERKASEYEYRIHWSPDEHGYVAFVAEFPTMHSSPAPTPQAAVDVLTVSVVEKLNRLAAAGEPLPVAFALQRPASA